jgi:hypothetical protein
LDLLLEAPNDTQVDVMASLARPALDYEFFQMLSDRIDKANGEEKEKLTGMRDRLVEVTREVDRQVEARAQASRELLQQVLEAENITQAAQEVLPTIDEFFVDALNDEMAQARKQGDLDKLGKLQEVMVVLKQASTPPPEVALLEELIEIDDEQQRKAWFNEHQEEITPEFMDTLSSLVARSGDQDQELTDRLQEAYRAALRFSMQKNLNA